MITKRTVLVLGAGASRPYNFPTGPELKKTVAQDGYGDQLLAELGIRPSRISEFKAALRHSGQSSVDAFLEFRPEYEDIGKALVAYCLVQRESDHWLFGDDSSSWYHYLFKAMRASFDRFGSNPLSVVTFNYDRSLEHYLHTCLCNSYNKPSDVVAEQLSSIPIVHVYGQLGTLDWQPPKSNCLPRTYTDGANVDSVSRAANGIKIITEHRDETDEFHVAHNLLVAADRIFFIGFGYDKTNIERLHVPWKGTQDFHAGQFLIGTAHGLTEVERERIRDRNPGLELVDYDAYNFSRNCRPFSWE